MPEPIELPPAVGRRFVEGTLAFRAQAALRASTNVRERFLQMKNQVWET